MSSSGVRAVAAVQCGIGAALLARPGDVTALSRSKAIPPAWLVRVLGARSVVQGVVGLTRPTRRIALGGAAVDLSHAATMIVAAVWWPDYRRAAIASGAVAVGSALAAAAVSR